MKMRSKLVVSFLQIAVLFYFPIAFGNIIARTEKNSVSSKKIVPQKGQKIWTHSFYPSISSAYPECWEESPRVPGGNQADGTFSPTEACQKSPLGHWRMSYDAIGKGLYNFPEPKRHDKKNILNGVRVNFYGPTDSHEGEGPTWLALFKCGDVLVTIKYFKDTRIEPKKHEVPDVLKLAIKGFRCKK